MKQAALKLLTAAGAFAPFRAANRGKVLIVTYHRFSRGDDSHATSAAAFDEQLRYLKSHYALVPLSRVAAHYAGRGELPARAACVTIDDGFSDAYEVAFPLLRRHGAPAALFVVTDFLDGRAWVWTDKLRYVALRAEGERLRAEAGGRAFDLPLGGRASRLAAAGRVNSELKRLPAAARDEAISRAAAANGVALPQSPPEEFGPVTWEQAREMDAAGVEIGSHTLSHPILTRADDEQLRRELRGSRARLEAELGRRADLFCYPNGSFDERVRRETERAGYACAVTTLPGLNRRRADPLALRRVPAEADLPHFVQTTSGFEQLKNRLRRQGASPGEIY
ncbi:MAG TPA: polysaccharide deacetylase family protein [Pyrinomonadaceae bacterium]|nr:polysaccharide deacetylase family protein [Pyrinomonadaceae bacterium]